MKYAYYQVGVAYTEAEIEHIAAVTTGPNWFPFYEDEVDYVEWLKKEDPGYSKYQLFWRYKNNPSDCWYYSGLVNAARINAQVNNPLNASIEWKVF